MNREILSEINRVREIMGVKLISEAPVNPKWFVSNTTDEIMSTLLDINPNFKGTLDDVTDIMSRDIDEIYDPFLREFRQSIDEVMQRQGISIDDILANPNLRKLVEGKFLNKVKNSSDLLDDFIEEYYVANPAARRLVDPKTIDTFVKNAASRGVTDLSKVESVLFKTVDDFETESGKKIPEIIRKEIKDAITSSVTGGINKYSEDAIESTIDNVILTQISNPKVAQKIKIDKDFREQIKGLLRIHNNNIKQVENAFKKSYNDYIRSSGKSEEDVVNGIVNNTTKMFNLPVLRNLNWNPKESGWNNLTRIFGLLGLGSAFAVIAYLNFDEIMNYKDVPLTKEIRAKFSFLPKTLREDYFNFIIQELKGPDNAKEILFNGNVDYTFKEYNDGKITLEDRFLTTISLDGKSLEFSSDNEGENIGDIKNTFRDSANTYNKTLDDFKRYLTDNNIKGADNAINDTAKTGFWKIGEDSYEYENGTFVKQ